MMDNIWSHSSGCEFHVLYSCVLFITGLPDARAMSSPVMSPHPPHPFLPPFWDFHAIAALAALDCRG